MQLKKIVKVSLVNFKSYENETISFDEDIVIIWGESREGKSNLIKALKFNLYNIVPKNMARFGSDGPVIVRTYWSDGTIIERSRINNENFYFLFNADMTEVIEGGISGFGTKPVPEVIAFHGMVESDFMGEKSYPNVASQFDLCFFVTQSDYEKAKTFGRMANVDVIDTAITKASSRKREDKRKHKENAQRIKSVKAELKELKSIDKSKKEIEKANAYIDEFDNISEDILKLKLFKDDISLFMSRKENFEKLLKEDDSVGEVVAYIDNAIFMMKDIEDIEIFSKNLDDLINRKAVYYDVINSAKDEDIKYVIDNMDMAMHISLDIVELLESSKNINAMLGRKEICEKLISSADKMDYVIMYMDEAIKMLEDIEKLKEIKLSLDTESKRKEDLLRSVDELSKEYLVSLTNYQDALFDAKQCPVCFKETENLDIETIKEHIR